MTATLSFSRIFPALELRHLIFLSIHSPFEDAVPLLKGIRSHLYFSWVFVAL